MAQNKSFKTFINEGHVDPNIIMSVQNIIKKGKADNTVEFIVVSRLLHLLKIGQFYQSSNPLFDANISTSKENLDILRSLPAAMMVSIARQLEQFLYIKDNDLLNKYANPNIDYLEWLQYFNKSEASD